MRRIEESSVKGNEGVREKVAQVELMYDLWLNGKVK
jgi:hypothetical protein